MDIDKEILEKQNISSTISKGTNNQLLLEESKEEVKTLRTLGWDEDIQQKEVEIGKAIELETLTKKHGDSIFSEETLLKFCVENNYTYCLLKEYKGPAPKELLSSITEYCKANSINLEYAKDSLFVLCPFDYNKDLSQNKLIKLRNSSKLQQIMLLEKVSEAHRTNNEVFYKVIFSKGKRLKGKEFIKSLWNTQCAQQNNIRYISFYFLFVLAGLIFSYNFKDLNIGTLYALPSIFFISLIFIIFKTFAEQNGKDSFIGVSYDHSINHEKFIETKHSKSNNWLVDNIFRGRNIPSYLRPLIWKKFLLTTIIYTTMLSSLFWIGRHVCIMHKFELNKTTKISINNGYVDDNDKKQVDYTIIEKIPNSYNYKKLNYIYDKPSKTWNLQNN